MDEHLCAWILEFILHQPDTESLTETLLRTLPLPDANPDLQKLFLLRSIRQQVADNSISDKTLEELEVMEQIHHDQGVAITESMKKAYCSVVLDCTVQACDKLWRRKSGCLEISTLGQLVRENFGMRREDVGPLVWDPVKTRNCALTALTEYVDEALVGMGPSFLESAANDDSLVKELEIAEDSPPQEEQVLPMTLSETQNPVNSTDPRSNADEPIRSIEAQMVKEPIIIYSDTQKVIKPVSFTDAENVHEATDPEESSEAQERCIYEFRRRKRPFDIIKTKETVAEPYCSPNYSLHSSKVRKVREALKVSCQELKAVVIDPLPDALRVSEAVASELQRHATKDASNKHVVGSQSELDKGVPAQSLAADNGALQYEEQDQVNQHPLNSEHIVECVNANGENRQTQEGDPGKRACNELSIVSRPSLMDRDATARTYEWEDPVSSCSEGSSRSRIRLPTPMRELVSPLRKEDLMKLGRRRKKRWSTEEEDALREGIHKYGVGNWELILKSNPGAFQERTGVDLKDKWRNMGGR